MFADVQTVIRFMERFAAPHLALNGDEKRIGLQVGRMDKRVHKILVALDVLENVVDEAIQRQAEMIVAHHAVIFRPLQQLRTDTPQGRILQKCMAHDLAVYVAHTNLDVVEGGLNDLLAQRLGLQELDVLIATGQEELKKLVVFVPTSHVNTVHEAVSEAGAGWIGEYSHCSFQSRGTGTFLPLEKSQPFIGRIGELERVEEVRLETIIPQSKLQTVLDAMLLAHPYEEVAFDLYPVLQPGEAYGLGRLGILPEAVSLQDFARNVKEKLQVPGLRFAGDPDQLVQRVAIIGGDGNSFVSQVAGRADVLVTGDVYYHTAHDALASGLALVDPGHNVEKVMIEGVKQQLETAFRGRWTTEVLSSQVNTEPFRFLT